MHRYLSLKSFNSTCNVVTQEEVLYVEVCNNEKEFILLTACSEIRGQLLYILLELMIIRREI